MSDVGWYKAVPQKFDEATERVRAALKEEGFGVLSEIRVDEKFREKLDVTDFPRYLILGACNPALANVALRRQRDIGLLLPCNVTLEETDDGTRVGVVKPAMLTSFWRDDAEVCRVADEATEHLQRVVENL